MQFVRKMDLDESIVNRVRTRTFHSSASSRLLRHGLINDKYKATYLCKDTGALLSAYPQVNGLLSVRTSGF